MDYQYNTKHKLVYECKFKPLDQPKWCGALIDNISNAPIFVLGYNCIESKHILKMNL